MKKEIEQGEAYELLAYTVWIMESMQTLRRWIRVTGGGGIFPGRNGLWIEIAICVGETSRRDNIKGSSYAQGGG